MELVQKLSQVDQFQNNLLGDSENKEFSERIESESIGVDP